MNFLLTLDLASRSIGWTCGPPDDNRFSSGTQTFPSTREDIGAFSILFEKWLDQALAGVSLVVFEAPVLYAAKANLATLRKLYGVAYHVELMCTKRKIECFEANNSSVKAFMGVSRAKGVNQKAQMIELVRRYGFAVRDDDEADAIAIRLYVIARRFPKLVRAMSIDLGPLGAAADNG